MIQQDADRIRKYLEKCDEHEEIGEKIQKSLNLTREGYELACKVLERNGEIIVTIQVDQRPYFQIKLHQ